MVHIMVQSYLIPLLTQHPGRLLCQAFVNFEVEATIGAKSHTTNLGNALIIEQRSTIGHKQSLTRLKVGNRALHLRALTLGDIGRIGDYHIVAIGLGTPRKDIAPCDTNPNAILCGITLCHPHSHLREVESLNLGRRQLGSKRHGNGSTTRSEVYNSGLGKGVFAHNERHEFLRFGAGNKHPLAHHKASAIELRRAYNILHRLATCHPHKEFFKPLGSDSSTLRIAIQHHLKAPKATEVVAKSLCNSPCLLWLIDLACHTQHPIVNFSACHWHKITTENAKFKIATPHRNKDTSNSSQNPFSDKQENIYRKNSLYLPKMRRFILIVALLVCVVAEGLAQNTRHSRTPRSVPYSRYGGGYIAGKEVDAIDISPLSVEVMEKRGVKNVSNTDLFSHPAVQAYDTVLMLMNGSGIIGKVENMGKFFTKMKQILKPGGVVYMDSSDLKYLFEDEDGSYRIDLNGNYYGEVDFRMQYKQVKGNTFDWLYIDFQTLSLHASQYGFKAEMVEEGEHYDYLAALTLL